MAVLHVLIQHLHGLQEVVEDSGAHDKMRVDMMSRGVGLWRSQWRPRKLKTFDSGR